ncbi:MAG: protease pro-enzyme activation domain-containing protein, partial [Actinomycetota bacterium]|nr:protease pro-enzyme activation domain-containing protein [Actinomycetota bacterium]
MVAVVLMLAYSLTDGSAAYATPTQPISPPVRLANEVPPAFAEGTLRPIAGDANEDRQPLTLTVTLNRTDEAGFQRLLADIQNPASPSYRHFLTQRQLADRFGPSMNAYNDVVSWLLSQGLRMAQGSANRLTITVTGTRTRVDQAFGVTINDYLAAGRRVYASSQPPAVPARIARYVGAISGLSNLGAPSRSPANEGVPAVPGSCPTSWAPGGVKRSDSGCNDPPPPCSPKDFNEVIKRFKENVQRIVDALNTISKFVNGKSSKVARVDANRSAARVLDGAGQTVGLLEYDMYHPADLASYAALTGKPPAVTAQVGEVSVNGGVATPGAGESEVLLDINTVLD